MPTSNMILSPQHSLTWDCCCTEDAEVTTDDDANDNGDEFDYNYQAPENGKPELEVWRGKKGIIILMELHKLIYNSYKSD